MGQCPSRDRSAPQRVSVADEAVRLALAHWAARPLTRDPRTGHFVAQGVRARRRFKTAVRRVVHWLLLRRRWSAIGRLLQVRPRADLWIGLHRQAGVLRRHHPAPTVP